jgi:hypothetical protein
LKNIKILGSSGDKDYKKMEETLKQAAEEIKLQYSLENVKEINAILMYGVVMAPTLVIDEEVVASGYVPSLDEMKGLLMS